MEVLIPSISPDPKYEDATIPLTAKLSDVIVNDRIRKNLQDIKSFANSLQEYGVIQPIVVKRLPNGKLELVAGQRRYEAAKFLGWKEIPITFDNSKAVNPIFIEVAENENRANFTMTERHEALQRIKEIRAKSKQEGVQIAHPSLKGKKSRDLVAAALNKGGIRTQAKESYLINTSLRYPQFSKLVQDVDNGKPVDPAYKIIKREVNKIEKHKLAEGKTNEFLASPDKCQLLEGDFREMSKNIANDSIDLIFTDPPYTEKMLWVYEPLGEIAARVLRPGGSLICYINQTKLPEILDMLRKSGLKYWPASYVSLAGPTFPRLYDYQIVVKTKQLLWFVKGNRPINHSYPEDRKARRNYLVDTIKSTKPKKGFHKWGQSPVEASYHIKNLTSPNDKVFDPFLGEGTTGLAAMKLHRRFIGIDKDPEAIKDTKDNLLLDG